MGNDPTKPHDLHKAVELVKERTAGRVCPFCDHRKWLVESRSPVSAISQLNGDANAAPVFLLTDTDSFWEGPPTIPAVVMTCENCGFIRLHNVPVLLGGADGG